MGFFRDLPHGFSGFWIRSGGFDILWFWSQFGWSKTKFGDFEGLDCWVSWVLDFSRWVLDQNSVESLWNKKPNLELKKIKKLKKTKVEGVKSHHSVISSLWRSSARSSDGLSWNRWRHWLGEAVPFGGGSATQVHDLGVDVALLRFFFFVVVGLLLVD